MPAAFAERADVRRVLQKSTNKFGDKQLADEFVDAAIHSVSQWFQNASDGYWYDGGGGNDLIDATAATKTNIRASVPSSPHRPNNMLFANTRSGLRYPNPQDGVHCRVRLPALYADSIDVLEVMDHEGEITDWAADADKVEGRGEDYYLVNDGADAFGRSYLYLRADELPARHSYDDALSVDVTYGQDWQDTEWQDVRRGVAALAGAQLVTDDDVIAQLPDQGQLTGVETQVQQLTAQALGQGPAAGVAALKPYLNVAVE